MPEIDWKAAKLVVFDVDGTLYDQKKLRRAMVWLLARHLMTHPPQAKLLRTIATYRKCRDELAEEEAENVCELQYQRPAAVLGMEAAQIESQVRPWIEEIPLQVLPRCRYPHVEEVFDRLRRQGRALAVYSDYPVEEKMDALGLRADLCLSSVDSEVDRFKPHPAGLALILERFRVEPREALMIGDRDDRDGEAARRLGVPFLRRGDERKRSPRSFASYRELLDLPDLRSASRNR